jgi:protein TonB
MSISIVTHKEVTKNVEKSIEKSVKKQIVKDIPKKVETQKKELITKEIDIDNLFSDVWTKSIDQTEKIEKKTNIRRLQQIQKKINKTEKKSVDSISKKFQAIDTRKTDTKDAKTSTATEVNEYLAKIKAIVYDHFYPPPNSQGNSVEAVIELSPIGKVYDFRILIYSDNSELNRECDKIKDRLIGVIFPESPDKKSGVYTIKLTSKE